MQLHLVFGLKLYHLGAIPKESCFSKWHLQEQWINTCCNLVIFYWKLHSRSASLQEPSGKVIGLFLNSSLYYKFWAYNNILREDELATHPQGGWARELYTLFSVCLSYVGYYHNILREDELVTYPRWGWARELNFVLSIIIFMLVVSNNILREDELATHPQGGWAPELCTHSSMLFMMVITTLSSGRMSSLHILRQDELQKRFVAHLLPFTIHYSLLPGACTKYPWGWCACYISSGG